MSQWIPVHEQLPVEGVYVLCLRDNGDIGVFRMVCGISAAEREKMKAGLLDDPMHGPDWCLSDGFTFSKRSRMYTQADEWGNNLVPYAFIPQSGPGRLFGQEVSHWMPTPAAPVA